MRSAEVFIGAMIGNKKLRRNKADTDFFLALTPQCSCNTFELLNYTTNQRPAVFLVGLPDNQQTPPLIKRQRFNRHPFARRPDKRPLAPLISVCIHVSVIGKNSGI